MARDSLGQVPPWLAPATRQLAEAQATGRFPHAILVHEAPGAGGHWLARWALSLMLCGAAGARPCGLCGSCRGIAVSQHPDCLFVAPEEDSREIRIDQIRQLVQELALTSHGGGYRGAVLQPADALNTNAANALLKTLEEPPPRVLLLLVAVQPARLPPTVLSRCMRLRAPAPAPAACAAWLAEQGRGGDWKEAIALVGAAPFLLRGLDPAALATLKREVEQALAGALAGTLDPGQTADRWGRASDYELRLKATENWLTDRIAMLAMRENRNAEHLSESRAESNIRVLFELDDEVRDMRALAATPVNRALGLERLFWRLMAAGARGTRAAG